ncbi:SusC/RagA family TonB-linked outer membrane protein [Pinibacter soli]|uniref:SusC/RagA family TonB-linked outer membrane protein n=1 Tax=Pinibacter soli TaxID=3044211 RepID=A0ABT6RGK0_9BACT|nr:SusC/RagA family TonB-linked outer membrane protein [Pinibacter soli]MDI3321495.1 SusC/RagA family TonB-linked outer membrane protein [Pinibacter soli]
MNLSTAICYGPKTPGNACLAPTDSSAGVRSRKQKRVSFLSIIALVLLCGASFAQQKLVSGSVKNVADDKPVAGASVMIKKSKKGTNTDLDGVFKISCAEEDTLVISVVGFKTKEIKVGKHNQLSIALLGAATDLQEVQVVTALGIKRSNRALGYSTTTVKGEQLTESMAGNWTDALSGKVAGLNLIRSNSGPAGSNKIILRGENNLTGDNEALIVVDGVVINQGSGRRTANGGETVYGTGSDNMPADYGSNLNDLNPADFEDVQILKGPGAAALYGQRGANGAIIITTKSGGGSKKMSVTIRSNANAEKVNRWPDLQYEYGQGLAGADYYSWGASEGLASTSGTSSAYGPKFNGQKFYQFNPGTQSQDSIKTPWVPYKNQSREYFQTGQTYTNSISVEGGTEKTTARFGLTNVSNKWILPNTGYKRNTVSMSVNSKLSDKLTISSKVDYNNKWSDNLPGAGYGNQSIMYWYIFWQPSADLNWLKNYWQNGKENKAIEYPFSSFPENPYAVAYEFINKSNRNAVTGNIQATYNFTKELSLQVRTSLDMSYEQRAQERPYDAGAKFPKGSYRTQNIFSMESSADFFLRYAKKINHDFDITASLGGSMLRNNYNRDEVRADSLTYPGIYSMANAAGPLVSMPWKSKYNINSLYGMITANYRNMIYLDVTGRQDWNSVLATPTRTENAGFFYPSANLSFILSDAVKLPEAISFAKLRFSASGVGSGGTTPYITSFNYTSAGSLFNGGLENPTTLANPNLKPLKTTTYEAGANVEFFKNRLGFDVAVYQGSTKNQILQRIVDQSSGYAKSLINIGQVNNKGIELSVNATPIVNPHGFKWTTSLVYSKNVNTIKQLADSSVVLYNGPTGGAQLVAQVGGSIGDLFGRGYVRAPDGQVVYDGTTGFALISDNVKKLGNTNPKGKIGLNNDFTYKQFHMHLLFDAQYGAVAYSLTHYKLAEQGKITSTLPGRYSGIVGNGVVMGKDGSYTKNTVIATDVDNYYRSHFGVDNAEGSTFSTDFIKFRELSLDYTINPSITKRIGVQKVTVGVYGRDLFIWSKWPGFDPEFGTLNGSDILQGFEIGQFPSTRSFGANIIVGL